jgi:tripartite-type tricarboxylate transporter receptor subunit TctC
MRYLFAAIAIAFTLPASAQADYPSRPVRFVVPYAPGGGPDVTARLLAAELAKRLGQPFVVENRTGAGGSLATDYVAKASADGYTILAPSEAPLVINPHVFKSVGYDALKDFAPVILTVKSAFYVVACPKLEASTVGELVALAKRKPVSYASSGAGTNMHLAGETLNQRAGIAMTHIPYKGALPAMGDVMNCNVQIGFGAYGTVLPMIKAGKLKALAISTEKRSPDTPQVPTLAEGGLSEVAASLEAYYGLFAPAKTPGAVVARLNAEVAEVLKMPAMVEALNARGLLVLSGTPAEAGARIAADYARYARVVKAGNIRAE